jgi:hypothetical protein
MAYISINILLFLIAALLPFIQKLNPRTVRVLQAASAPIQSRPSATVTKQGRLSTNVPAIASALAMH